MTKVAVFAFIAMGAACTGGEPVTELGQVFGDRPSAVGGPGTTPGIDGGLEAGTGVTPTVPRTACALSADAKSGLIAYFPLDTDVTSHGGRATATPQSTTAFRFAPGKIGRALASGQEAWVTTSLSLTLAHYTVCAWVAPGAGDEEVRVLSVDTGPGFSYPTTSLRQSDFNLVCWLSPDGSSEIVVVNGGGEGNIRGTSPRSPTNTLHLGDLGGHTIVDEVAIFGPVLTEADLTALWAGGRGCLLEGLR
jgi:hypothetical protein